MVHIYTLDNGIRSICDSRIDTGKLSIDICIKGGSIQETDAEKGLCLLMHKALLGGTEKYNRHEIAEFIEQKGGVFISSAARHNSALRVSFLSRYSDDVLSLLSNILKNPSFETSDIDQVKSHLLKDIKQRDQNPSIRMSDKYYEAVFGIQGQSPVGDKNLIQKFTINDIKRKHTELLATPDHIVVSFSGDISNDDADKLTEKYFSDIQSSETKETIIPTFQGQDIREDTNNEQLNIMFGFKAPACTSADRYSYLILDELLSGGMASPLFQEIREKRGLVYSIDSGYSAFDTIGTFLIAAGTGQGQVGEVISLSFDILSTFLEENTITQKLIDHAQERIIRDLKRRFESADFTNTYYAEQLLRHGFIMSIRDIEQCFQMVTPAHIQKSVYEILSSKKYALSCVGPQKTMPSQDDIINMMTNAIKKANYSTTDNLTPITFFNQELGDDSYKQENSEIKITTLENGLRIVTDERQGSVSIGAWVGAGSDFETAELNGATHMNEHMMFRGTPSFQSGEIDQIIEMDIGGDLNAYTSKDKTAYYFYNLLPEHMSEVVHICGDMVFNANINEEEYSGAVNDDETTPSNGERSVVIEEIKKYADDISSLRWDLMDELSYPNQSHGRAVLGTEKTVMAISSKNLRQYRDDLYTSNNVVFAASGPIKHDDFVQSVKDRYETLKPQNISDIPEQTYQGGTGYIQSDNATLNALSLSFQTVPENDPLSYSFQALDEILGNGQSSRLYNAMVNKENIVSAVATAQIEYKNLGQFAIFTNVEIEKTHKTVEIFYHEIYNVIQNVTKDELDKAKAQLEIQLLEDVETNMGACRLQGEEVLLSGQIFDLKKHTEQIQNLNIQDVKNAAKFLMNIQPTLAMVVPEDIDLAHLPSHENVLSMRQKILNKI